MYFKITNEKENHHGFQYHDGLNILSGPFNDNPEETCVEGGFYFTTEEFISKFYGYGIYLRIVELPTSDPDFKMIKLGNKYRANKIILKEKYLLSELATYQKFRIPYPTLELAVKSGYFEIVKYLVENGADIHNNNDHSLRIACQKGHFQIVKYLVKKGANIHVFHDHSLNLVIEYGHLDIVQFLIENGCCPDKIDELSLVGSLQNGHFDILDYLVKNKCIDINNYTLINSMELSQSQTPFI